MGSHDVTWRSHFQVLHCLGSLFSSIYIMGFEVSNCAGPKFPSIACFMDRAQLVHFTKQGYQPLSNVGQSSESSFCWTEFGKLYPRTMFCGISHQNKQILKWGIFAKEKVCVERLHKTCITLKFLKKKKGRISKNPLDKSWLEQSAMTVQVNCFSKQSQSL